MLNEFKNKLNNGDYISRDLFLKIKNSSPTSIPANFDLDIYNNNMLNILCEKYKDYFSNMYKGIDENIVLDNEQIKAILTDEKFTLIIAGAGTGKTTTMVSKVKYLVDIKKVDPTKILVMSYTKKATTELEKRIVEDFKIPAKVTTFHSLGYSYIREIFKNRKCYVVDFNKKNEIFYNYFITKIFPFKDRLKEIIKIFNSFNINKAWVFSNYFKNNYEKYDSFKEYFENYKKYKLEEAKKIGLKETINNIIDKNINGEYIITLKGEIVKSKGEALIANFLYINNIDYSYEKLYTELMTDNLVYKPDFTVNYGENPIYIEYFGLSNYSDNELDKYEKIKIKKEDYHRKNNTKFIKIDYMRGEEIIKTLKMSLINYGVELKEKTDEEIYDGILSRNPLSQMFPFKEFMFETISAIKESLNRDNYYNIIMEHINKLPTGQKESALKQFYYVNDFYHYYQNELYGVEEYGFEYSDLIYYSNKYIQNISNNNILNFQYIIIDEYQDISKNRYELAKNTADITNASIIAVGDDWQSIYGFNGSRIDYIYNFQKYFPGAKILGINKTYRISQELTDYSGNFIMKNNNQIKKELISDKYLDNPIKFVYFEDDDEYLVLKKLILNIYNKTPKHRLLILGRTNKIINKILEEDGFKDEIGTKITFIGYENIDIEAMTIHKSKGLTFDEVIIIGLNKNFPNNYNLTYWMQSLFKNKEIKESVPYAEERRVFYVALTRTKNHVYMLVNKNPSLRSDFISEIEDLVNDKKVVNS